MQNDTKIHKNNKQYAKIQKIQNNTQTYATTVKTKNTNTHKNAAIHNNTHK